MNREHISQKITCTSARRAGGDGKGAQGAGLSRTPAWASAQCGGAGGIEWCFRVCLGFGFSVIPIQEDSVRDSKSLFEWVDYMIIFVFTLCSSSLPFSSLLSNSSSLPAA